MFLVTHTFAFADKGRWDSTNSICYCTTFPNSSFMDYHIYIDNAG